jgi:hypothetical protein
VAGEMASQLIHFSLLEVLEGLALTPQDVSYVLGLNKSFYNIETLVRFILFTFNYWMYNVVRNSLGNTVYLVW